MYWPECLFWEGLRAKAILIAYHHKLEVKILTDEAKIAEYTFHKTQFLKRVYLLILWLINQCAIAVDK